MTAVRPFVLVVLDGWGRNADPYGNAIAAARTPEIDALEARWPHTEVAASGEAVGLPPGQQGNSEVGHLTIGAGRLVYQPLSRINRAISDGSFFENAALCGAVDRARDRGAALHCLGLISPGGVHSHQDHAVAMAELARRRGLQSLWFHAFLDGRDEPPTSAAGFVRQFAENIAHTGVGAIASVSGRYYAMDRDRRWDRLQRAYDVIAGSGDGTATNAIAYIEDQYAHDITDEFVIPISILNDGTRVRIEDGDQSSSSTSDRTARENCPTHWSTRSSTASRARGSCGTSISSRSRSTNTISMRVSHSRVRMSGTRLPRR